MQITTTQPAIGTRVKGEWGHGCGSTYGYIVAACAGEARSVTSLSTMCTHTSNTRYTIAWDDNHTTKVESWQLHIQGERCGIGIYMMPDDAIAMDDALDRLRACMLAEIKRQVEAEQKEASERDAASAAAALIAEHRPAWATHAIVASLQHDKSDVQSDYFGHTTSRRIIIGWSKHGKDLFPEMRKAAALYHDTAHLGTGKGVFRAVVVADMDYQSGGYWHCKGEVSPWHSDIQGDRCEPMTYDTRAAAEAHIAAAGPAYPITVDEKTITFSWEISEDEIEHREKYSMGGDYYLKSGGRNSDGWTVHKEKIGENCSYELAEHLKK